MPSTRERQIKFMNSFGERAVEQAIAGFLIRNRMTVFDLMSDEIVAEITSRMVASARRSQRDMIRNRNLYWSTRPRPVLAPSKFDAAALHLAIATTAPAVRLAAAE